MIFLLDFEPEFDFVSQDSLIVKQQLDKNPEMYSYVIMKNSDFYDKNECIRDKNDFPEEYLHAIPVGSVQFVESFLKIFYNIDREESIEVPEILRTRDFLKRDYRIVSYNELPKKGRYFIKDVTEQRSFSYLGDIEALNDSESNQITKEHMYQISEVVDALAEFRVYVIGGKIVNISFYKGDPCLFPDIKVINCAVDTYNNNDGRLQSYSMDFMVTPLGTAIIEMHTYMSLGLYWTKWDESLIQGYIDSLKYIIDGKHEK